MLCKKRLHTFEAFQIYNHSAVEIILHFHCIAINRSTYEILLATRFFYPNYSKFHLFGKTFHIFDYKVFEKVLNLVHLTSIFPPKKIKHFPFLGIPLYNEAKTNINLTNSQIYFILFVFPKFICRFPRNNIYNRLIISEYVQKTCIKRPKKSIGETFRIFLNLVYFSLKGFLITFSFLKY